MTLSCTFRFILKGTLVVVSAFSAAQNTTPPAPPDGSTGQVENSKATAPAFRSTTNLVIVDVVVTHSGRPVKGLQQPVFHLLEDGREQTIKTFEEHSPGN